MYTLPLGLKRKQNVRPVRSSLCSNNVLKPDDLKPCIICVQGLSESPDLEFEYADTDKWAAELSGVCGHHSQWDV